MTAPTPRALGVLAALLVLGPASAPARAAGSSFGDVTVTVEEPPHSVTHGYSEMWVTVTNRSEQSAHQVRLTLPRDGTFWGGDHVRSLGRAVEVAPKSTARVSLLLPARPAVIGSGLSVAVDGRAYDDPVPVSFGYSGRYGGYYSGGGYGTPPLVLVSRGVPADFAEVANARFARLMEPGGFGAMPPGGEEPPPKEEPKEDPKENPKEDPAGPEGPGGPGGPGGFAPGGFAPGGFTPLPRVQFARSPTPPAAWGPNWLGYSGYDAVLVAADDLKAMPAAVQTALWQYAECGGTLLVLGRADLPGAWRRRGPDAEGVQLLDAAFGTAAVLPDAGFKKWPDGRWARLLGLWNDLAPLQRVRSTADANRSFPVIEDIGVPVKGLFVLMVVFALVIGPVNLILLARWKRKLWLLGTVPAVSLATCLAVFGYMAVSEGWQGHARTEGVTVLDEGSRRAATIGWTGFYSPLTPSDGLHFSRDTEVAPQNGDSSPYGYRRENGNACTLDWTDDQHLASGWVTARVPAHFTVRKAEARRERVAISRGPDGAVTAVNELGADIDRLWYADGEGRVYAAEGVPAGARAALRPTGETLPESARGSGPRRLFHLDWPSANQLVRNTPTAYLAPRGYLAALESAPFLDEGLRGAAHKARSVVIGVPREGGHAD
jgi:hypothetical protein